MSLITYTATLTRIAHRINDDAAAGRLVCLDCAEVITVDDAGLHCRCGVPRGSRRVERVEQPSRVAVGD